MQRTFINYFHRGGKLLAVEGCAMHSESLIAKYTILTQGLHDMTIARGT
jgi:hypothetical protein